MLCTGAWDAALCVVCGVFSTFTGAGCAVEVLGFVTVSAKLPISTPPVSSVKRKVSLFPLEGVNLSELVPVSIVKYVVPSAATSVVLLTGPLTRMVLFGIAFETFTVTASPSLTLALAGLTVAFFAVAGVVTVGVVVVPAGGVAVLVVPAGGLAFVPAEGVVDVFVPADGVVAVPALGLSAGVVVFAALESGRILLVQLANSPIFTAEQYVFNFAARAERAEQVSFEAGNNAACAVKGTDIGLCGGADGHPSPGEGDIVHERSIGVRCAAADQLCESEQVGGSADLVNAVDLLKRLRRCLCGRIGACGRIRLRRGSRGAVCGLRLRRGIRDRLRLSRRIQGGIILRRGWVCLGGRRYLYRRCNLYRRRRLHRSGGGTA